MSLGRVLKNIRVARDLSREEVVAPKYSISHLAAVEQGVKRPSIRMLTHVADRLRVSLEMLVPDVMENGIPVPEMIRLARSLCREGKFDLALDILQQANDKDENDGGQYRVDHLEAEAYIEFGRNNLDRSLDLYSQVSKIRERGGNPLLIAQIYHSMGLVERRRDRLQRASHWFFIAWEKIAPEYSSPPTFALELLHNYGDTLMEIGEYPTARSIYERCIALMTSEHKAQDPIEVLRRIAECATKTGDLGEAEKYLLRAVKEAQGTGRRKGLTRLLTKLGTVIRRQGRPEQALPHLVAALDLAGSAGTNPVSTLNEIAQCHLAASDDVPEEIEQWEQSITGEILERATEEERTLFLLLKSEVLKRREQYGESFKTAREAFCDASGSLNLRILAIALDASQLACDSSGVQWVVDQLRCLSTSTQ